MPTLQEQIVILGVKIGALTVSLNGLKAGRVAELEHGRAIADTEFRLAAQERASSRARLDDLNSTTEHNARGGLALGADLKALTKETAEWIDELQTEDIAHTRRLDEHDARLNKLQEQLNRILTITDRIATHIGLQVDVIGLLKVLAGIHCDRLDELKREVEDHELRLTHQAEDQVEFVGKLADLSAIVEIPRVPSGHGLLPEDYDSTAADEGSNHDRYPV